MEVDEFGHTGESSGFGESLEVDGVFLIEIIWFSVFFLIFLIPVKDGAVSVFWGLCINYGFLLSFGNISIFLMLDSFL